MTTRSGMGTTTAPSASAAESTADPRAVRSGAPDGRLIALCFGALLVAYSPTLLSFLFAWSRSTNEHGFFAAGLVIWLCWRDRQTFLRLADGGVPDLAPLLALLSVGWLFASIMEIGAMTQTLFVVIATGWALAVLGWGARAPVLSVALTATLGLPVWGIAVPILQRATTVMSGLATLAAGIEAEIGYDTITISSGVFLVESGCAGLRYLMAGLTLGALYAHLFVDRWQTQLKVVAVAGVAAIVGNWIRVTALVFLGEATQMQSPYIEDHLWQGWAVFAALMVPTYLIAVRIERRDRHRMVRADEPAPDASETGVEAVAAGRDANAEPRRRTRPVTATLLAALGPLLLVAGTVLPRDRTLDRDPAVFGLAGEWSPSPDLAGDRWRPTFTGVDERADWTVPVGDGVLHAARHYFVDQRSGEELIQWANEIAPDSLVLVSRLVGPIGSDGRIANEVVVLDGDEARVVWYWYRVAGFDSPFPSKAKLLEVLAFFRRTAVAELVTLSAVCGPESCEAAAGLLRLGASGSSGSE